MHKKKTTLWFDADGKRVKVTGLTPEERSARGYTSKTVESKNWYCWIVANGKREQVPLAKSNKAARSVQAKKEKDAERRAAGLEDEFTDAAKIPIDKHVDEWIASLRMKKVVERQVVQQEARVRLLIKLAGWKKITDIKPNSALKAISALKKGVAVGKVKKEVEGKKGKKKRVRKPSEDITVKDLGGVSAETRNHYRQAIKQFAHWCADNQRLPFFPLASLKREHVGVDRRHDRREVSPDEIMRLMNYLRETETLQCNLTGTARSLLYEVAFLTGFRRGELRSLSRKSFDLEERKVTVKAAYSKNRRESTQKLKPETCLRLADWFASGNEWVNVPDHTAIMLRRDLEAVGIPYELDGKFADFHALRHSYISNVCRTDATMKQAMELARHSDPRLTFKTYGHVRLDDLDRIVDQLPSLERDADSVCTSVCTKHSQTLKDASGQ